ANPNNPTGGWHPPAKIAELMARVPPHILVVLDEAYREYVDGEDVLRTGGFPNLLITRTFSKIHGLAGLRAGFGIGDAEVIAMLNRIRQPFNLGGAAQTAALAALADDAHIRRSVEMNAAGMKQIAAGLDEMQICRLPSRANFITFCAGSPAAAARIYDGLLDAGIIIRPLSGYEMPEFLRVTVGREDENRRFLRALAELWK
ncbi:MAG: pyridoxal phosphate-dependent aminotransferase, partial [Gammaproteobacteria bacterium]